MYNMEQPLGDASAIVFAIACKETAKHTKLCYSGEGADEFFGGYNMYRNAERYGDNLKDFYVGNTNIMKEDEKKRILKSYNPNVLPINLVKNIYDENLFNNKDVYKTSVGTERQDELFEYANVPSYMKQPIKSNYRDEIDKDDDFDIGF